MTTSGTIRDEQRKALYRSPALTVHLYSISPGPLVVKHQVRFARIFLRIFPSLGADQRQHALQRVDHRLPPHRFAVPLEDTALGADFLS